MGNFFTKTWLPTLRDHTTASGLTIYDDFTHVGIFQWLYRFGTLLLVGYWAYFTTEPRKKSSVLNFQNTVDRKGVPLHLSILRGEVERGGACVLRIRTGRNIY